MGEKYRQDSKKFLSTIRQNIYSVILVILLLTHLTLGAITIFSTSPTYDEGGHVYAGLLYIRGDNLEYYFNNPPFAKYLFGLSANLFVGPRVISPPRDTEHWSPGSRQFMTVNGTAYLDAVNTARFVSLLFSLIGCLIIYSWTRKNIGNRVALLAVALWSFSPAMISMAALATPDMVSAVLFMATIFGLWRYKERPDLFSAWLVGLLAIIAVLTKFSNVLLYLFIAPVMIGIFIYHRRLSRGGVRPINFSFGRFLGHILAAAVVSFLVLGAAYQWEGIPTRFGDLEFHSKTLSGQTPVIDFMGSKIYSNSGNRFETGVLGVIGQIPLPIPEKMILGFDAQIGHENYRFLAYLDGYWKRGGWPYYYIYTLALKTPIFILLVWVGMFTFWFYRKETRLSTMKEIYLVVPAAIFFIVTSMADGINSHSRYVLPVIPFIFIWVSRGIDYILVKLEHSNWRSVYKKQIIFIVLVLIIIWPVIQIHPHYLSYFNGLVGGPKNGWKHLIDSNIDWGQDLPALKEWLDDHPEVDKINLAYFGSTRPDLVLDQDRFTLAMPLSQFPVNRGSSWSDLLPEKRIAPGWYAVSVNLLAGLPSTIYGNVGNQFLSRKCAFCYFQIFEPIDRAGYSIYIYYFSEQDVINIYNRNITEIYEI